MQVKKIAVVSKTLLKAVSMMLVGALLITSPVLAADENDGNALLKRCKSVEKIGQQGVVLDKADTNNLMYCLGYITGFTGMYYDTALGDNFKTLPYCLAQDVNWKPLARIVVDFLETHPELTHQPQEVLTNMAFSEKFPCIDSESK